MGDSFVVRFLRTRDTASPCCRAWSFGLVSLLLAASGCSGNPPPTRVAVFASVSAGGNHSCAVTDGGVTYCWGANDFGELGNGTTHASSVPVAVAGGLSLVGVSAGGDGSLTAHTCGWTAQGAAYCWGDKGVAGGALGDGTGLSSTVPVAVAGGLTFASINAGDDHTCGVTASGAAHCWGANGAGELGNGSNVGSFRPAEASGGLTFASVSAGFATSCGATADHVAYCWGTNAYAQLGNSPSWYRDINVPLAVDGGLNFARVSVGTIHVCALTPGGVAYCWGGNLLGVLGSEVDGGSVIPAPVSGGLTFATVSAGNQHTCGVTTSGAAYCWGDNAFGELGDGSRTGSSVPVQVKGGLVFSSVATGSVHTCGVTRTGETYCWGFNDHGQLGNGSANPSNVPVPVVSP